MRWVGRFVVRTLFSLQPFALEAVSLGHAGLVDIFPSIMNSNITASLGGLMLSNVAAASQMRTLSNK